jgi:hypothetical protein
MESCSICEYLCFFVHTCIYACVWMCVLWNSSKKTVLFNYGMVEARGEDTWNHAAYVSM